MTNVRAEGLSSNFQLWSTGLTQITKRKQYQECFGQAKRKKMKNNNLCEEDFNNGH